MSGRRTAERTAAATHHAGRSTSRHAPPATGGPLRPAGLDAQRPQQARSIERREKLVTAARELFGTVGYEATSVEDITARAQASVGAFYTYFRSKKQLMTLLMTDELSRYHDAALLPTTGGTSRAAFRAHAVDLFRDDVPLFNMVRAWQEAATVDPEIRASHAGLVAWSEAGIRRLLWRYHDFTGARADRDIEAFARIVNHHTWSILGRASTMAAADFNREMIATADFIYHYFFRDER